MAAGFGVVTAIGGADGFAFAGAGLVTLATLGAGLLAAGVGWVVGVAIAGDRAATGAGARGAGLEVGTSGLCNATLYGRWSNSRRPALDSEEIFHNGLIPPWLS